MTMKKIVLTAVLALMPVMAQECPDMPADAAGQPAFGGKMKRARGQRRQLTEEQKAEMKAKFEARRAEMFAKYDTNKDGRLDENERKAAREDRKARMQNRCGKRQGN